MPYLSRLLDSRIIDTSDKMIGRLKDVLISPKAGEYVPIKYLVVQPKNKKNLIYIPYSYIETFSHEEVSLKKLFKHVDYEDSVAKHFVMLRKDVLDQQIVDISGARVVRVNDLRLGNFDGDMCVLGVDVSFKGLLRRLGFEWMDFLGLLDVHLIDWRQAQPVHRSLKLDTVAKSLARLHPADLANVIEDLSINRGGKLVKSMDSKAAAHVLREIDPHLRKILVKYLGPQQAADILSHMSNEEIADLMKMLPRAEARLFLDKLHAGKVKNIEKLIVYPDDTAGGLMSMDYVTVKPDWTVKEARDEVKRMSPKLGSILYVYVTDGDGIFEGVVSLRWLLVAPVTDKISDLMKECPLHSTLRLDQNIEEIIPIMTKYDLYTVAVLDEKKKLVGIVTIDDVMRHLVPNA
ncbi:MAG: CBS domain-containing protein [Candidatus Gracilibacteria bacterium]